MKVLYCHARVWTAGSPRILEFLPMCRGAKETSMGLRLSVKEGLVRITFEVAEAACGGFVVQRKGAFF